MAASRQSPKRRSVPRPINTTGQVKGLGLGIRAGHRSAIGSATVTVFPPSPQKSSLRSGSKTPSPDANRVHFAGDAYPTPASGSQARRGRPGSTPRAAGSKTTTTTTAAGRKSPPQSGQTSPFLRFSPRTAAKAKRAAQAIQDQLELLEAKIPSPTPQTSKLSSHFAGHGKRIGTGRTPPPLSPESNTPDRSGQRTETETGLITPTDTSTRPGNMRVPGRKMITITSSPGQQRQIYIDGVSDWLALPRPPTHPGRSDGEGGAIEIPTSALLSHMHHLKAQPRALSLEELSVQFYLLQKLLRQFSKAHFSHAAQPDSPDADGFSLASLSTAAHAPFLRMVSYIADGASYRRGWRDFLTSAHTRPHIACATVSEWLKHNVFGHSCFGLSAAEDLLFRAIDVRYLHYDGFVRTKERARLLARILADKPAWEAQMDLGVAVDKVVSDLLVVLAPILPQPPPEADHTSRAQLRAQLTAIVAHAAALHHCIRLTGRDGTVLRLHGSAKGDRFAHTARQNCVNKSSVTATIDEMIAARARSRNAGADAARPMTTGTRDDTLRIKMVCFPVAVATVPYGPTLRDFAVEQERYGRVVRSEDLPRLGGQGNGPMYIEDIPAEIVRASCFEEMPESYTRNYGAGTEGRGKEEKKKRAYGSYVRQYLLNESDVYCEWEFAEERGLGTALTLRQAVEQAQREKYGFIPEERRRSRRRMFRTAKYVATAGVAAAFVYGVARRTGLTDAVLSTVKSFQIPGSFSVEDIKAAVGSAMKVANARTKVSQKATARSFRIVKNYTRTWAYRGLAAARSQLADAQLMAGRLYSRTGPISKAPKLTEAATSVLKTTVRPVEAVEPPTTSGLLSSILQPKTISVGETPHKVGIKIIKVADPTSKVSKTTKAALKEKATEIASNAVRKWYERWARGVGN